MSKSAVPTMLSAFKSALQSVNSERDISPLQSLSYPDPVPSAPGKMVEFESLQSHKLVQVSFGPGVVVIVDNSSALIESSLAVCQCTFCTRFFCPESAGEITVGHNACHLFSEAFNTGAGQVYLRFHARCQAFFSFAQTIQSTSGSDALNEFGVLADVIQINGGASPLRQSRMPHAAYPQENSGQER